MPDLLRSSDLQLPGRFLQRSLSQAVCCATQTVTFNIAVLPADEAALKTARGVTNELVMEHANNVGTPLTEAVQPSAVWKDVALFIDQNRDSLKPIAETKYQR